MHIDRYPNDQNTACARNGRKDHDDDECDRDQLAMLLAPNTGGSAAQRQAHKRRRERQRSGAVRWMRVLARRLL